MPEIAGILLAAGSASRFGGNKLLHPLGDGTPVALAAARALVAAMPDSVAVVRPGDSKLVALLSHAGLRCVENPLAPDGMGTSLAAGVRATTGATGWIVALADMPWIASSTVASLAVRLRAGASIVAPTYRNRRGHPVGFAACWRDALLQLDGDAGARSLLAREPRLVELIETDDAGVVRDIDYREDAGTT